MNNIIGIDLGGTNIRLGVISSSFEIVKLIKEKSIHENKDLLYKQIKRMLNSLLDEYKDITKIGISAAGFIDNDIIKYSPNLNISDFDLVNKLKSDFSFIKEIKIANDANASAFMESRFGAGKDYDSSLFITISSGIGVGLVINKKLINLPFESGHNYINYKNDYYELEYLASGNGIINLCRLNNLNIDSASSFFKLVKSKDPKVLNIYQDWLNIISTFICNNHLNYNTSCIILSGGLMLSKDIFIHDVINLCNIYIKKFPTKQINILEAKYNQEVGLLSGASLIL